MCASVPADRPTMAQVPVRYLPGCLLRSTVLCSSRSGTGPSVETSEVLGNYRLHVDCGTLDHSLYVKERSQVK